MTFNFNCMGMQRKTRVWQYNSIIKRRCK